MGGAGSVGQAAGGRVSGRLAPTLGLCCLLVACQQVNRQALPQPDWCYFGQRDLLVHRVDPRSDNCLAKGGAWLTDGQADLLQGGPAKAPKIKKEWLSCVFRRAFVYEKIEPNPRIAVDGALGGCSKHRYALIAIFEQRGMRPEDSWTLTRDIERLIRGVALDKVMARRARGR